MSTNEKRKWIIYMYTFPNGKRYIGKTSTSLKDRQGGANWAGYSHCTVLMKAVKKYGVENIKQEILFEDEMTDEYSSRLEQICILLFKTNCRRFKDPQHGYNTTDGGEGAIGHRHTDESKQKMSESKKKCSGDAANSSKPVYCVELDKIFPNGVYAEKETGVNRKLISQALHRGTSKTCGGTTIFDCLHWQFATKKPRPNKEREPKVRTTIKRQCKEVYCIELDTYFESAKYASDLGYGAVSSIQKCCNGSDTHAKYADDVYYHWLYKDDVTDENIIQKLKEDECKANDNSIYCIELNMYFVSPDEAQEMGYGKKRNIMESYRGVRKFTKLPNGTKVHWLRAKDVCEENIQAVLNDIPWKSSCVEVYCLEQDKLYSSEREADRLNGFPDGYVSRCINGFVPEDKLQNGLHWRRAKIKN